MEVLAVGKTNGRWLVRRGGVGWPDWGLSGLEGLFGGLEGWPGPRAGWPGGRWGLTASLGGCPGGRGILSPPSFQGGLATGRRLRGRPLGPRGVDGGVTRIGGEKLAWSSGASGVVW